MKRLISLFLALAVLNPSNAFAIIDTDLHNILYDTPFYSETDTYNGTGLGLPGSSCGGLTGFNEGSAAFKQIFVDAQAKTGVPAAVLAAQSRIEAGGYWNASKFTDSYVKQYSFLQGATSPMPKADWEEAPALSGKAWGPTGPMQLDQYQTVGENAGNFNSGRLKQWSTIFGKEFPVHGEVYFDSAITYAALVDLDVAKSKNIKFDTLDNIETILRTYGTLAEVSPRVVQTFEDAYKQFSTGCTAAAGIQVISALPSYGDITPTVVVLHWWGGLAGSDGINNLINTLRSRNLSVQLGITRDGKVYQLTPKLNSLAYHAICANSYSIGIEIEGRGPEDLANDQIQFDAVVKTTGTLMQTFKIPLDGPIASNSSSGVGVHSHKEIDAKCPSGSGKDDVDDLYLSRVKQALQQQGAK